MATGSPRGGPSCRRSAGYRLRLLYLLALYLATPLISLLLLWRGLRDRSYWHNFRERFGFGVPQRPGGVWVHAVSVGEVQASAPLIGALSRQHPGLPLTVTTFTPTGAARARALFGNVAQVRYVPFDLPGAVRRFFARVQPQLAVIFETELWPNLYRECGRRRVPLVLASARVSARSAGRYAKLGRLFSDALAQATVVAAQGTVDAERFRALGADPASTHVTGSLKFDFELPPQVAAQGAALRRELAPQRPVWVAGSTHGGGEEQVLIDTVRRLREKLPQALLVMAPRHPQRFAEAAQTLTQAGITFVRRSEARAPPPDCEVLLLDSLGELIEFYAAGDVAFVGGSLVPVGGHNLLEPAALGLPVLTGPHNFNSPEVAHLLIERGAVEVVHSPAELAARLGALLTNPEERLRIGALGRACVDGNRGALAKLLSLIEPLLP
jgi:3-deoxy-D-manno-octulosonic-acid transferase